MTGSPRIECLVMGSLLPLLLLSTTCSGYTTHYIKPTPSTPCPTDPCFTLSEYAQQRLHYVTSNTTLLLLPGDHVLSVNFTVENVSGFKILSSEDSYATKIVCQGFVGFFFRNISHMVMDGLTFNSCGKRAKIYSNSTTYGVSVHSVMDTSIFNCSFQDSIGTALGVFYSSLNLSGSNHFTSNCKRCGNNTCLCWGGGIYAKMSTLMFTGNSIFRVNSAEAGGGIYIDHSTLMTFNGNSIFRNNAASYGGGILASLNSTLNFSGNITFENNSAAHYGGGINAWYNVTLMNFKGNSIFRSNSADRGGGIWAYNSALYFSGSSTFGNNSATRYGGGIRSASSILNFNGNSIFRNNGAHNGGGIHASQNSTLNFTGNITFENKSVAHSGGGIFVIHYSHMNFNGSSIFKNNSAAHYGGGFYAVYNTLMNFKGNSTFRSNSADHGGGILARDSSTLYFSGSSMFGNNSATRYGGGIYSISSILNFSGNSTFRNSAEYGGGIFTQTSTLSLSGSSTFENNSATRSGGGIFAVYNPLLNFNGNIIFRNNSANSEGGGIYVLSSNLTLNGNTIFRKNSGGIGGGICAKVSMLTITGNMNDFMNNSAKVNGGAVYTENSVLSFEWQNIFSGNSAQYSAGGVYSKNSTLTFSGSTSFSSNMAELLGGAIYGFGTLLHFLGNSSFTANTAARGGGEYLVDSFNFLFRGAMFTMESNNVTEYGGAVYVKDSDPISYCFPDIGNLERCFIQVDVLLHTTIDNFISTFSDPAASNEYLQSNDSTAHSIRTMLNASIHISNNHAQIAGSAVFGGSIDNCAIEYRYNAFSLEQFGFFSPQAVGSFRWHIPNLELEPNSVSSDPFQVCLCKNGVLNCSTSESDRQMQVYPGQMLKLPVVATGQRDGITPAVVRAFFDGTYKNISFAPFQDAQNVLNNCTELYYQVHSSATNKSGTLVLYADGPCSTDGKVLNISLEFLDCPPGFALNPSEGICECEPRLQMYTNRCNITERTLERSGDFWVGYDKNFQRLVLHPHCPFDYCISANISLTLNDTDKLCKNSRSGLLCGECKSGFSLALGSSKCLQCSNIYILLLIPFALAGIALVLLLFIFKLTVAAGTINGLIFYANIVAVNRSLFFPPNETNILTVFIAWLNLDLGMETCFFDGMDVYVKTWLQFVFPLYVWSLVVLIIIGSEYSTRITKVFGSNPVAVLATLFLLSYAKLLRTIIAALYPTYLDYPNEKRVAVWQYDGNVLYFHGKHSALFLVALLTFLVFFLPYTFLLTFGQWFQAKSNRRFFYWINNPRIKPFFDAYQAPYKDQHRYWTGLMLCLRCVLYLVFVLLSLVSADPSHNLLAIEVVVIGLLTLTSFTGLVHKMLYLDVLEASFILNLGILAAATYSVRFARTPESQGVVTYISVGIAFATFVVVLVYHIYQQVWPKLQQRTHQLRHRKEHRNEGCDEVDNDYQAQISTAPTMSIVECPSPELLELKPLTAFNELREPLNLIDTSDH